jgi:hypothetical protein
MSIALSNNFTVTVQNSSTLPAYAATTAVMGCKSIPNTRFMDFIQTPQLPWPFGGGGVVASVLDAWGGLAQRKVSGTNRLIAWGGGHNNYAGNDMYELDIGIDAPTWRLIKPYTLPQFLVPNQRRQNDGNPVSIHSYWNLHYVNQLDELNVHGLSACWDSGNAPAGGSCVERFTYSDKNWLPVGVCPQIPFASSPAMGKCKHPVTEHVWWIGSDPQVNGTLFSYDPITRVTTNHGGVISMPGANGGGRGTCIDVGRNLLVCSKREPDPNIPNLPRAWFTVNLSTRIAQQLNLNGAQIPHEHYSTLMHDTIADRYIWITPQMGVYSIHPTTHTVTQLNFTGDTPPLSEVTFNARTIFDESLRGFISVPRATENAFYFRLHA